MGGAPPNKRKQAGKSLKRICQRLNLPFHKTSRWLPRRFIVASSHDPIVRTLADANSNPKEPMTP